MICSYDGLGCDQMNSSGMTQLVPCNECKRYIDNNGVRATGALPYLGIKRLFNKVFGTKVEPEMYDQVCTVCGKTFKGNIKSPICPSCYI